MQTSNSTFPPLASAPAKPDLPGTPGWRSTVWWLVAVSAVASLLRLWIFNGLGGHDDWPYLFYVRSFLNGDCNELLQAIFGLRWGVWVPIAALFKIFGVHYWLAFLPGFLIGLTSIPLAYLIVLRITDDYRAARWATLALAVNPIDWFVATTIRGDIEMSFASGLIVLGLVMLETPRRPRSLHPALLALATGLIWGFASLTHETAYMYGWGFFGLVLWRTCRERRIPWVYANVLLGFVVVLVLDGLFLYLTTDIFQQRFLVNINAFERMRLEGGFNGDLSLSYAYLPSLLLNLSNKFSSFQRFINGYPFYGWYFYLFLGAVAWGIGRLWGKRSPWISLLCFIGGTLLWFEFGSMSIVTYIPLHKEPRYLSLLSVPIACVIGWALNALWQWLAPRGRALLVVLLLALTVNLGSIMWSEHVLYTQDRDFLPEFVSWLQAHPDARVWVSSSIQQDVDLRFGYRFFDAVHSHQGQPGYGAMQDIVFLDQAKPGDLILVTPVCYSLLGSRCTPEKWERIARFEGPQTPAALYRMNP